MTTTRVRRTTTNDARIIWCWSDKIFFFLSFFLSCNTQSCKLWQGTSASSSIVLAEKKNPTEIRNRRGGGGGEEKKNIQTTVKLFNQLYSNYYLLKFFPQKVQQRRVSESVYVIIICLSLTHPSQIYSSCSRVQTTNCCWICFQYCSTEKSSSDNNNSRFFSIAIDFPTVLAIAAFMGRRSK